MMHTPHSRLPAPSAGKKLAGARLAGLGWQLGVGAVEWQQGRGLQPASMLAGAPAGKVVIVSAAGERMLSLKL